MFQGALPPCGSHESGNCIFDPSIHSDIWTESLFEHPPPPPPPPPRPACENIFVGRRLILVFVSAGSDCLLKTMFLHQISKSTAETGGGGNCEGKPPPPHPHPSTHPTPSPMSPTLMVSVSQVSDFSALSVIILKLFHNVHTLFPHVNKGHLLFIV